MDEEQRRQRAIELLAEGRRPGDVLRELGRTREWLAKWRRRFEETGAAGLRGRSRAHHAHPRSTPGPSFRRCFARVTA
jgi:transposase-like protein